MSSPQLSPAKSLPPFYKLDDAGRVLARDAATWSQTYDPVTGLVWANKSLKGKDHAACMTKAAKHVAGAFKFRAPTSAELMTLIHHEHRNPATDPEFFANVPADWHWSSSPVVGWPEFAWDVDFSAGGVYYDARNGSGFVRPVRAARPRQYLAVGDLVLADGATA